MDTIPRSGRAPRRVIWTFWRRQPLPGGRLLSLQALARQLTAPPATVEDRNIRWLMLQTALAGVANGGIITFLPVYLARLGASSVTVSLVTALPALVTILTSLPAGAIVAGWQRLVPASATWFYLFRFSFLAITLLTLLDPALAPTAIVAVWGLAAVASTVANTAWYSVLAAAVSPRRRPAINGVRWALLGIVAAASTALFGFVLEALPFSTNFRVVFAASFVTGLLNIWAYAHLEVPDRALADPAPARFSLRRLIGEDLGPVIGDRSFRRFLLVTTVLRLGLFLPVGLFSIFWVRDLAASDGLIGLRTTVGNAALTVGYYLWGRAAARWGYQPVLVLAALGLACYPVLTGLTSPATVLLLLPAALVWGLFASGIDVSLFEALLSATPDAERPRYVAVNTLAANLVAFAAPVLGAALADRVGIPPVLFAAGLCLLGSAGLMARSRR